MAGYRDGRKIVGTFEASAEALADADRVHRFLRELVERIGMTALGYHVYDVPMAVRRYSAVPDVDEGGLTGVVVLSTSHAAVHTWPEEGGARVDVDSCKSYDPEIVDALLVEVFGATEVRLADCSDAFRLNTASSGGQP